MWIDRPGGRIADPIPGRGFAQWRWLRFCAGADSAGAAALVVARVAAASDRVVRLGNQVGWGWVVIRPACVRNWEGIFWAA